MHWPTPGHFPSNHARPGYVAAAAAAVEAARAICDCPVVTCFSAAARNARLGYALRWVARRCDCVINPLTSAVLSHGALLVIGGVVFLIFPLSDMLSMIFQSEIWSFMLSIVLQLPVGANVFSMHLQNSKPS